MSGRCPADLRKECVDDRVGHRQHVLAECRQRRVGEAHQQRVVVPDHGDITRHVQPHAPGLPDGPERHHVRGTNDRGRAPPDEGTQRERAPLDAIERIDDHGVEIGVGQFSGDPTPEGGVPLPNRHILRRAKDEANRGVTQLEKVGDGILRCRLVVVGDAGRRHALAHPIDEDHRQPAGLELQVAVDWLAAIGMLPGDKDDAGHAPIEKHRDIDVLVDAAGGLGAQHRREAPQRKAVLDGLGKRREDRVAQLGDDEANEGSGARPHPTRWVDAEHVDCGEHGVAGRGRDARAVVDDPRDGGFANPGPFGDIR